MWAILIKYRAWGGLALDKNSGHDGAGIGTNSLHLYNHAFGYAD